MRGEGLTVALALLVGLILVIGVDVFGLGDPVQVTLQIFFQLLLLAQLLEVSASFSLFPLLGKLSAATGTQARYKRATKPRHVRNRAKSPQIQKSVTTSKIQR